MENKYEYNVKVFKALCDPNRLMILEMLQSGEKCACEILESLNIVQSTLSHHMKMLCESGLVSSYRDGKWMYYSIDKEGSEKARRLLAEITKINDESSNKKEQALPIEQGNVESRGLNLKTNTKGNKRCCCESDC